MTTRTIFDVDGTILINDLPQPDWDDPDAVHPITGEHIYGHMPIYNCHCRLNPQLQHGDLDLIRYILTGRPECRKDLTIKALAAHGIQPILVGMWPQTRRYTHADCIAWKANYLRWVHAAYYVDNDPDYCRDLTTELQQIGSECCCISVAEWQQLLDMGVFV